MIQTPADELLKILARSHPMPSEQKLDKKVKRIEKMAVFYEAKIPEAPEKQAMMFAGFVSALFYAKTMINQYRKLTQKIAEAADDDERTL